MQKIILEFTYTQKEIMQAYSLHYNKILKIKRDLLLGTIICIAGIFMIYYDANKFFAILFILFGAILFLLPIAANTLIPYLQYQLKSVYKKKHLVELQKDKIIFKPKNALFKQSWKEYIEFEENHDFFILYYSNNQFTILPKRIFIDFQYMVYFRQILKQNNLRSRIYD